MGVDSESRGSDTSALLVRTTRRSEDSLGERVARANARRHLGSEVAPTQLGRFTVARSLGRGGQGCVFEGFDAQLERRVALKIPRYAQGADLAFEARALAKVRHPNLVTVYALEVVEGRPVVVMELVEGTPLLAWVERDAPSLRQLVEAVASVGDGLAELHTAGLTHRDVKPGNILVDDKGQARLVDLGLAAQLGHTDRVRGTPRFAAPEQLAHAPANPAADQFSLAATLQAALARHPAAGRTRPRRVSAALRAAVARSSVTPRARPTRLSAALERALADDPEARFGSVTDFAHALRRSVAPRRIVGYAGVATLTALGLLATAGASEPECAGDPSRLASTAWAAPQRDALRDHFAGLRGAVGDEAFAHAEQVLDDYAGRWSSAVESVCASPAGRTWEGPRARCLDDAAHHFATVVDDLGGLDHGTAKVAPELAIALAAPERCTDVAIEHLPPVLDREESIAIRRRLAEVERRCRFGLTDDCEAQYDAIAADAEAREVPACVWRPRLLGLQGDAAPFDASGDDAFREAEWAAEACGRDDVRLAVLRVMAQRAALRGDETDARRRLRSAEATLERMGRPRAEEIGFLASKAATLMPLGRHAEAAAVAERAVALHEDLPWAAPDDLGQLYGILSGALHTLGQTERAVELQHRAVKLQTDTLGEHHPSVAFELNNLAVAYDQTDKEAAREYNRRAIEIFERHPEGYEHVHATALAHAAGYAMEAGELEEARTRVRRARALFEAIGAGEGQFAANAMVVESAVLLESGAVDEALALVQDAVAMHVRTGGPHDTVTLGAQLQLAKVHEAVGDPGQALTVRCDAMKTFAAAYGDDHPLREMFTFEGCS